MSMSKCLPADLPVGFGFEPKVEQIIFHYLGHKMIGKDSEVDYVIRELNFYDFDPWDLPPKSRIKSDDQIWWFFCRQEIGKTNKRTTKSGRWEITGETQDLMARDNKTCIGKKKILVFYKGKSRGKSRGSKPIWVVHEYHPLVKNPQRPYIICRLQKRTEEKAGAPGCYVGEPSGSDTASVIENPVTPAAVSGVHGHGEENADPSEQPPLSPSCYITLEDIGPSISDQENNSGMHENHPNPENSLSHQGPCVYSQLEKKTDEMDGTPCHGIGKPSGDITSDVENQEVPIVTPEVHGRAEENADSPLSRDFGLTEEDMISILSSFPNDGQQIDSGMDEFRLVPENSLLHKGPYVISGVENKTDEKAGSPGHYVGEPSGDITSYIGNQVAPTAIPEECGRTEVNAGSLWRPFVSPDCHFTEKDKTLNFSNSFNDNQDNMQATCEADDKEAVEFADRLIVDPSENYNGEMPNNLSNGSIQPTSLKRSSSSVDTGVEGVDGRFKRSRTLASENHSDG